MPVIDDRGRLFGKLNLIDAIVMVVAMGLIPLSYGAFMLFREQPPIITSIQPMQVTQGQPNTLLLTGEGFRPFLVARLGDFESSGFLVESPTIAEVRMPDIPAGNYDFVLYDQARELVRMPGAITVVPPSAPITAIATVRVRFVAGQEVLDVMNIGDVDLSGLVAQEDTEGAVLMAIGQDRQRIDGLFSDGLLGRNFQVEGSTLSFTGRVRVPVVLGQSGWTYRNQAIKVGAGFTFESILGVMRGFIFDMVISDQEGGVLR
mgnify:FL=1